MLATLLDDLRIAAVFLTRLPVPFPAGTGAEAFARAVRLFPVIGLVVGLLGAAIQAAALWIGLPALAAAALALGAMAIVTGALHEDGLADTADGLGARADRDSALAIMRDSRIGVFGAMALMLVVILRVSALATIGPAWLALPVAEAAGRAAAPVLMAWLPPARKDGLSAAAGRPPAAVVAVALSIAAVAVILALGPVIGLFAALLATLAVAGLGAVARRRLGGQTGDIAGAGILLASTAVLLAAAIR